MLNTISLTAFTGFFGRVFADQSDNIIAGSAPSTGTILLVVLCAIVLGTLISVVYMFTHRKTGYSQSMAFTIPMLSGMVSAIMIMMCLLSSTTATAAAISLTGAFSLVRFRSAAGDPRDIAFIFYGMTVGVICGIGYIGYAVLIFAIMAVVLLAFHLTNFALPDSSEMTLKITIPENLNYNGLFDTVLNKYTDNWLLRRVKTTEFGTLFELVYSVRVKNSTDQKKFIDELRTLNGNLNVTLVLFRYDDQIYEQKTK